MQKFKILYKLECIYVFCIFPLQYYNIGSEVLVLDFLLFAKGMWLNSKWFPSDELRFGLRLFVSPLIFLSVKSRQMCVI